MRTGRAIRDGPRVLRRPSELAGREMRRTHRLVAAGLPFMRASSVREILTAAASDRGTASVSVIERAGAAPRTCWVPDHAAEPAFLAYSITKSFTASLVLMLCEEERLSLEDPLARWFPGVADAERMTVRHLLNHTSGIPDYGGLRSYHDAVRSSPSTPWPFDRFAAETFDKGLLFPPGQGWAYSNPGYMLVRRIAENAGGAPYRALVAERIAEPLGLHRTFVAESIGDLAALAAGTSSMLDPDGSPRDVRHHYHPGWVSHGVVASTASDVVRFLDALFDGRLVARHSLDQMMKVIAVPGASSAGEESPLRFGRPSYGLGLMVDPASPWGLLAGHNGGGPCYGASAFHAFDLDGLSVCAMGAIEDGFEPERVVAEVLDRYAGRSTRRSRHPSREPDADLPRAQ